MKEKPKKSVRMWVARDKNNKLYVYQNKPIKSVDEWKLSYGNGKIHMLSISNELFPSVKWEDKEPTRVVLRLI